jgi:signal transduction histidine kinase
MSRKILALALSVFLGASIIVAESNTPKANTRADIKAYVEAAANYVAKHGPSCEEFAEKDWRAGDYYIFVLGPDDRAICHPSASLIGKPIEEIIDKNGKHAGEMIAAAGKKKGGGWVEYVWPRPGTDNPVAKSTFATHVKAPDGKTYIVGSGGYELK